MSEELDLSMFEGVKSAEEVIPEDRIKLAIQGPAKSGKSHTAITCELPIFAWDFDDRKESLNDEHAQKNVDLSQVFVKTLFDYDSRNPSAFRQLEADIAMFEYNKSQGKKIPATFVLDSGTYLGKWAMNYYFYTNSAGVKEVSVGSNQIKIARGFDPYLVELGLMETVVKKLFRLGHVIMTFHEADEKDKAESTQEKAVYTGFKSIHPPRYAQLLPIFNEVWRQTIVGGQYKLVCKPNHEFIGATTLYIDQEEEPNITKMLQKHRERATLQRLEKDLQKTRMTEGKV